MGIRISDQLDICLTRIVDVGQSECLSHVEQIDHSVVLPIIPVVEASSDVLSLSFADYTCDVGQRHIVQLTLRIPNESITSFKEAGMRLLRVLDQGGLIIVHTDTLLKMGWDPSHTHDHYILVGPSVSVCWVNFGLSVNERRKHQVPL